MVSSSYILGKSSPPSGAKRFFDQQALPVAIDAAGSVEAVVESLAKRIQGRPMGTLGLALGLGILLAVLVPRSRRGCANRLASRPGRQGLGGHDEPGGHPASMVCPS